MEKLAGVDGELLYGEIEKVWFHFTIFRESNHGDEAKIREYLSQYNFKEELLEPMTEAVMLFCFGMELTKLEARCLREVMKVDQMYLGFQSELIARVRSRQKRGRPSKYGSSRIVDLEINPFNLIATDSAEWTIAGEEYGWYEIEGEDFSNHLSNRQIVDIVFLSAEELAHFGFRKVKSDQDLDEVNLDNALLERLSDDAQLDGEQEVARVIYHAANNERRAMNWKWKIAQRHFPSLRRFFEEHNSVVREYRKEMWLKQGVPD